VRQLLTTIESHHAASGRLAETEPAPAAATPVDGVSR
jgi:hypothetical protein